MRDIVIVALFTFIISMVLCIIGICGYQFVKLKIEEDINHEQQKSRVTSIEQKDSHSNNDDNTWFLRPEIEADDNYYLNSNPESVKFIS